MSPFIRSIPLCVVVFAAVVGSAAPPAFAGTDVVCSPFVPHTRAVGNTANDIHCTDDTVQAAIDNTVCPNTTIFLTTERTYNAQHLNIQNKSLSIVGTNAGSCSSIGTTGAGGLPAAVPTAPLATISGTGNGGNSVISIGGNSGVTLQFVEITGGSGGSGSHGGGINFTGTGSLTIDTSTIDLNNANFGGGIEINGNGGTATLTLKPYSVIESNTASGNGGGINLDGNAQLVALQPNTFIGFNHAPNGKGGGIAIVGPANASIGSPGYAALPVIDGNDAALGGGISVQAVDVNAAQGFASLYSTDPQHPVALVGNFASQAGGGVYLKPLQTLGGIVGVAFCASDFQIDGNAAPEGAAIYEDQDAQALSNVSASSSVALNPSQSLKCAATPGSVPCAAGVACNTLDGNQAVDSANHPQPGAVLFAGKSALHADRIALRHNSGAHAIRHVSSSLTLSSCLIADNDFSAETLRFEDDGSGGESHIDNCTITGNTHNSGSIVRTEYDINLTRSILDQPFMSSLSLGGAPSVTAHYLLAADPTGLPAQADIVQGEPIYTDPARGNYHLQVFSIGGSVTASMGVDFAPVVSGQTQDLDGNPRDVDVPAVPNDSGVRDLGAYEAQPILDRIFADAFGDPMSLVY